MLEVMLLGQFDVRRDGTPIAIPSRASQSLLAYLLLSAGTPHRREKLAGLLWPNTLEESARHNLRHELWRIRKAIEAGQPRDDEKDYLIVDEFSIAFNADSDYSLDVAMLERAHVETIDDLIEALAVYRDALLPGFYADWVVSERERLSAIFARKMVRLLECLVEEKRWKEILDWGARWIARGQSPEAAYRALMLAHSALGDRAKMAAVYQRCVEALRKDLGVEPSPQTRALCDQLRVGERVSPVAPSPLPPFAVVPPLDDELPAPGDPPFKGLQYFDESDAALFFGRELLTAKLVAHLLQDRFLAVIVGASGSGKSSIVRAGLVPALKRGEALFDGTLPPDGSAKWQYHLITPTAHPLEALAASLTRDAESVTATTTLIDDLTRDPRSLHLYAQKILAADRRLPTAAEPGHSSLVTRHLLLVVDQFEELFTLCQDEFEREAFIDNLLFAIAPETDGKASVVITLRADFYAHCAQYPDLREALAKHQEYIGPMSVEELRRAIEEPAKHGGWELEPGLVDLVLRDVGDEPGALPLLSHALLETWKRRRGRTLSLKGYEESGGVRGAIAKTAETVFHELTPDGQRIARGIFLRLTELGEGTQDTRRRAAISELIPRSEDAPTVQSVLKTLADARLITTGDSTAEVAHEALIREWPMLREWLNQDREGLRLHRRLTEDAQEWEKLGRDPGALYRGALLSQGSEWAASPAHTNEMNVLEREFLDASKESAQREATEREAQRQRELHAAQRLAESSQQLAEEEKKRAEEQSRAARQLRLRAIHLTVALIIALVMAGIALFFGDQARSSAIAAQTNARQAQTTSRIAFARELSVASVNNLEVDPERSILLALQAVSETYTVDKTVLPEAATALHRAVLASHLQLTLVGHTGAVWNVAYSPDGTRIATSSQDGTAKVWDAMTGKELLTLRGHTDSVNGIAYSPDGKYLATASDDGTGKLWDASTGKELLTLSGHKGTVLRVAFSPDGTRVATTSWDKTAKIWDVSTGKELLTLLGHTAPVRGVAFSPDGTRLATISADNTVKVWNTANGKELLTLPTTVPLKGGVAFSPDGTRLAASNALGAKVWDATSGRELLNFSGHTGEVFNIAYSADGTRVATCSTDGTAKVWDAATGTELLTLAGHNSRIDGIAFSPDGTHLATSSEDYTTNVWDISPGRESLTLIAAASRRGVALSPDGTRLAMGLVDGTTKVWDAASGKELLTLRGNTGEIYGIGFSRDGTRLATGSADNAATIWDASTGRELLTLRGHADRVYYVAFSPDGTRLATASLDKTAKIWDTSTGTELLTLRGHTLAVNSIAFSPDGTRIATSSDDQTAKLWDAATGKEILTMAGHRQPVPGVAFNSNGTRLITASVDGTAKVWDASTGRELLTLNGHSGPVISAAFSPDGTRLATASADKTAKVWDATTGKELFTLFSDSHDNGGFTAVTFSPDGTRLVTSNTRVPERGTVRVYLVQIEDLVALARSRLTRTWTLAECQKLLHMEQCPSQP